MPLGGILRLVETLDHDLQEVNGQQEHSYQCRRCAIARGLRQLKNDFGSALKRLDESIGSDSPDVAPKR